MITLKSLITEVKFDYGCVMAQIQPSQAPLFTEFGKQVVPDNLLYNDPNSPGEFGREKEPHVTIKFGLTESYTVPQMQQFLAGSKPFQIVVKGMSIFETPLFDVIKLDVEPSGELLRLREVFDKLPNKDEHPEYHPHLTLAYVLRGTGKKFQRTPRAPAKVTVNMIKYSDRGKRSDYQL